MTWTYEGRAEVRPLGRGIHLDDLTSSDWKSLEDAVPEGRYYVRLVFEPVSDDEYRLRAPSNLRHLTEAIEQLERGEGTDIDLPRDRALPADEARERRTRKPTDESGEIQ